MRTFERDYTYLLLSLIPHHRLTPVRRKQVEKALQSRSQAEMRRSAVLALEELCDSGYVHRSGTRLADGDVLLTYARNNGAYQIELQLPEAQWQSLGFNSQPLIAVADPEKPTEASTQDQTHFEILPQVVRSFSINDNRESLRQRLETVVRLLPTWLHLEDANLVVPEEAVEDREAQGEYVMVLPEESILRQAVYENARSTGRAQLVDASAADALGLQDTHRPGDHSRVAIAPVLLGDAFWGVLELWFGHGTTEAQALARVDVAVRMVVQVIENATQLQALTSIDKLTQVYNRMFYDKQIRVEIERAQRSDAKLSMLVVDIDDFKRLNDTLGHRKGDEALAMIADLIQGNLRKIDMPFRYGGEEFVVLLPGTTKSDALHTAERLRARIAESTQLQDTDGQVWPLHVSIGAAVFPDNAASEEELFSRADAALYRAKRRGKDRVEFYGEN